MHHGLELMTSKKYEIDLSNEVLNFDFGQRAAKIPEVKVRVRKKYLPISQVGTHALGVSRPPTLTSDIFAAP